MPNTIVLLADASKARIFDLGKKRGQAGKTEPSLEEKICLAHPERRHRSSELLEGNKPSGHGGLGSHAQGLDDRRDSWLDSEDESFAKDVVKALHEHDVETGATEIYVMSSPRFLGHLRKNWKAGMPEGVFYTINIADFSESDALQHLRKHGHVPNLH